MANYLDLQSGKRKQIAAINTSAGAADSGKIIQLDAAGLIDETMLPNVDVQTVTSGEALTAGDFVYIDATGEAVKASAATAGMEAIGFVKDSVGAATSVKVYFEGVNANLAGLTIGSRYYLDQATAGGVTLTAPASPASDFHQFLGYAISATEISTEITDCITLA